MKPAPPPDVPGNTEWERFDNARRQALERAYDDIPKGRGATEAGAQQEAGEDNQ